MKDVTQKTDEAICKVLRRTPNLNSGEIARKIHNRTRDMINRHIDNDNLHYMSPEHFVRSRVQVLYRLNILERDFQSPETSHRYYMT